MNYSKVQFISWELTTGPRYTGPEEGYYPGFNRNQDQRLDACSQCIDIEARIKFTESAIASAQKIADSDPTVLKVFMAPEFLYRGAGGAYLHDLINGWQTGPPAELGLAGTAYAGKWGGLFGGLQKMTANDQYKNWVFVFGTAISASFPTYLSGDKNYYLDDTKMAEAYNSSLIQLGGKGNTAANYASRKHYISGIDFLKYYTSSKAHTLYSVLPADPQSLIPSEAMGVPEGGACFTLPGVNDAKGKVIDFGMEICLDHAFSGGGKNRFGRLRTAGQFAKIQLVPSAGMTLQEASVRLQPGTSTTPNSYVFNCDGLGNLNSHAIGCHTQIWNGANGAVVPGQSKLVEASNGQPFTGTSVAKVSTSITMGKDIIADTALWVMGSGNIRAMKPMNL